MTERGRRMFMTVWKKATVLLSDDMKLWIKKLFSIRQNRKMLYKEKKVIPYQKGKYPFGINLIGDISAETGLGQSMRILATALEKGNIPFIIKQKDSHGELEHDVVSWEAKISDDIKYAVNLIHIIPGTWAKDYCKLEREVLDGRYNIAYWLWELETFPEHWIPCIDTVDEIWTPSEFISNCIRKVTNKPVMTVPYAIEMDLEMEMSGMSDREEYFDREYFGLPENKFLFLTMYDFISVSERKNPEAVIKSYCQAFPQEDEMVGLIIKVNHAEEKKLEVIKNMLKNYRNVYYVTDNLTRTEVNSLIDISNVLVSLHRSEGFGLPIAEAMAMGKPVICTNWSATTEFMDDNCACPVGYQLIRLEKGIGPYEKGNYWADADIGNAATYMRRLVQDKGYYGKISKNAKERIRQQLTCGNMAAIMRNRLKEII
ncbi:glycosyltransferase family 1 protein [Lachnospiraceae bacterium]|nr:glycosyltransferase family 1 protein [Lachnospiraceae bacterium]